MQAVRSTDGAGLDPALAAQFLAEAAPAQAGGLWLVRDAQTGRRANLQSAPAADAQQLAYAAKLLGGTDNAQLCKLLAAHTEGDPAYLLTACLADGGDASALPRPAREWAALQLLDVLHALQGLPEPVALPQLDIAQLRVMPQTGYLRLADCSGAQFNARLEALKVGRAAGVAVLSLLLHEGGAAEHELLAAWENEGAEAYAALRLALQRAYLEALAADF